MMPTSFRVMRRLLLAMWQVCVPSTPISLSKSSDELDRRHTYRYRYTECILSLRRLLTSSPNSPARHPSVCAKNGDMSTTGRRSETFSAFSLVSRKSARHLTSACTSVVDDWRRRALPALAKAVVPVIAASLPTRIHTSMMQIETQPLTSASIEQAPGFRCALFVVAGWCRT